ncbi:MAG: ArsR/SmtB family transcription factor [Candidatus Kariarchaeaceae archaeon]|jgi:predicted transcriptional regulator
MEELFLTASEDNRERIIAVTKAIASNTRYRILELLTREELDISRLAERLDQTEANVSAQVKQLEKAKLVESRYEPGDHGVRKLCKTSITKVTIQISPAKTSSE